MTFEILKICFRENHINEFTSLPNISADLVLN